MSHIDPIARAAYSEALNNDPKMASPVIRSDPDGVAINSFTGAAPVGNSVLEMGVVVKSIGILNSYVVQVGQDAWVCSLATTMSSPFYGASQAGGLLEGTRVVVMKRNPYDETGVILGAYPQNNRIKKDSPLSQLPRLSYETGAAQDDGWLEAYMEDATVFKAMHLCGLPVDAIPGEWHIRDSLYGARLSTSGPVAEMVGSPIAKVRVNSIDDSVTIVADTLKTTTAVGDTISSDDGGVTTIEEGVSIYKHERLWAENLGDSVFKVAAKKAVDYMKGLVGRVTRNAEKGVLLPRLKIFKGYLGGIIHAIVSIPKYEYKDQGVCSFQVGAEGRVTVKTAAGISILGTNKIPVPMRKEMMWSNGGTKGSEVDLKSDYTEGYKYHDKPTLPEFRSAQAYRTAQAYEPFHKFKDDFELTTEGDVDKLDEEVDKTSGRQYKYDENTEGKANVVFNIEPDGTVMLGGGEGCEIMMKEGRIILHAPRGIFMSSGKDIVQLAGGSHIVKAHDNIDMIASDKDIRIKAKKNLHIVASDEGNGNVIIESKSKGKVTASGHGDGAKGKGILFKCDEGEIGVASKNLSYKGEEVTIRAEKKAIITAKESTTITSNKTEILDGKGLLAVTNGAVDIYATSLVIGTSSGISAFKDKSMLKTEWASSKNASGPSMYEIGSKLSRGTKDREEDQLEGMFDKIKDFHVTYRDKYDVDIVKDMVMPEWYTNKDIYEYNAEEEWEDDILTSGEDEEETRAWPGKEDPDIIKFKDFKSQEVTDWEKAKNTDGEKEEVKFDTYPRIQ